MLKHGIERISSTAMTPDRSIALNEMASALNMQQSGRQDIAVIEKRRRNLVGVINMGREVRPSRCARWERTNSLSGTGRSFEEIL